VSKTITGTGIFLMIAIPPQVVPLATASNIRTLGVIGPTGPSGAATIGPTGPSAHDKAMMPEKRVEDHPVALTVMCDAQAKVMLERLLGPATGVVETDGDEPTLYALRFRLKAPAESQDAVRKLALADKLATKIVGIKPSAGAVSKLSRITSHNPNIVIDLDDALRILEEAANCAPTGPAAINATNPTGLDTAVAFLEKLRPGGPWVLVAIVPDGEPTATTAFTADQVAVFIRTHNGKANLYYQVNPTRTPMSKKAAKTDIAAIEYILGDCDPASDETPEAAKGRYLEQLNGAFEPKATAGVDSGNGIQGLWKLEERITLGELINGKFSAEDQAKIADAEARAAAVMQRLGAKAGTQNIDRILRLPGTINLPNAKKRKEGRTECRAKLLWFDDTSYPLEAFPKEEPKPDTRGGFFAGLEQTKSNTIDWARVRQPGWLSSAADLPDDIPPKVRDIIKHTGTLPELNDGLLEWGLLSQPYESWSDVTFALAASLKAYGKFTLEQIAEALLADLPCNQHVTRQKKPHRAVERAIARSFNPETPPPLPPPGEKLLLVVELGSKLWGSPTTNGREYRFGADQSKVIDPIKGMWFDHTTNKGGNLRELIKKVEVASRGQSNADDVVLVCAADIVPRPLDWIWTGHLLRGSQELLSGLPDHLKSVIQIGWVACATARLPWPNGAPAIEPMNVIMLTAEDTLDQIVIPRLLAAGANMSRVQIIKCIKTDERTKRQFLLAEDLERLEWSVKKIGDVGLITIDPITAYMGGKTDSHKATEVRAQLGPLKDFSEHMNIAISTITHPPKSAGARAIDHFIASQAFIAACRVGHLVVTEMEDNDFGDRAPTGRMLFTNVRNTAHDGKMPTLAYRKEKAVVNQADGITAPRIVWEGSVNITSDEAVAALSAKKQSDQQIKVQAFLRELLKDGKQVPQKEIEEAAEAKGFTAKQLRTAREKLGIHTDKEKGTMSGGWVWQLPDPSKGKYHF
jgi:hypothetical protein